MCRKSGVPTFKRLQAAKEREDQRTFDSIYNNKQVGYTMESSELVFALSMTFRESYISEYFLIAQTHRLSNYRCFIINCTLPYRHRNMEKASLHLFKAEKLHISGVLPNFMASDINGNKI
jgi:hypothetical protein